MIQTVERDSQRTSGNPRKIARRRPAAFALTIIVAVVLTLAIVLALALAWLRWDAGRSRDAWFDTRKGTLTAVAGELGPTGRDTLAGSLTLASDTGLTVDLRIVRPARPGARLPVLLILGGHRTGRDAVDLAGDSTARAVVALDYPYDGSAQLHGLAATVSALPRIRRALLDTPPAISLAVDWLHTQSWVDRRQIVMVGASLGVPFAATAAARDPRLSALLLVHGAADNRRWLAANVLRGIDAGALRGSLATVLYWLLYGPAFDTAERVAAVAPRPVLIVGARNDERVPGGETERLFAAAGNPKKLRWTEGPHLQPGRTAVIDQLLAIADQELPLPASSGR